MMKSLIILSVFLLACGESGQTFLSGDEGGTEIPTEFLDRICGGSRPEFQYTFKINSSAGGGRLSGRLEEGQYRGNTNRKFIGQRGSDGILYIEEKGEEQFNIAISVCRKPPGEPYGDFRIEAVGLSVKTNRCPPYNDINYATISFSREAYGYYGPPRTVTEEFNFSASCL